jgi:hypothetical protein
VKTYFGRRFRALTAAVAAVCLVGVIVASVSSGRTEAHAAGSAVSATALAHAKAVVAQFSKTPSSITVNAPLTKKPKKGQLWVQIAPPGASTVTNEKYFSAAAHALGEKAELFTTGTTSASLISAFNAAVAAKPAAVWVSILPPSEWMKYGTAWLKAGIPVLNPGNSWPDVSGKEFNYYTLAINKQLTTPMADWIIANANGQKTGVLSVWPTEIPLFGNSAEDVDNAVKQACPSCTTQSLSESITTAGTTLPSTIVGYLQKNPATKYLVMTFGQMMPGVVEALKTAGLYGKVKIIVDDPQTPQNSELKAGEYAVGLPLDQRAAAYVGADFFARALTGQSTAPDFKWLFPEQFVYAKNVGDPNSPYLAGPVSEWYKLWGVS